MEKGKEGRGRGGGGGRHTEDAKKRTNNELDASTSTSLRTATRASQIDQPATQRDVTSDTIDTMSKVDAHLEGDQEVTEVKLERVEVHVRVEQAGHEHGHLGLGHVRE